MAISMTEIGRIISAMGTAFTPIRKVRCIKEIGIMINKRGMAKRYGPLAPSMKELIIKA